MNAPARPAGERRKGARFTHPPAPALMAGHDTREADAMHDARLDLLCIDRMRALPMEQVERRTSGRPAAIAVLGRRDWLVKAMQNSEGA